MGNSRVERWKEFNQPSPAVLRLRLGNEGYRVSHWADRVGTVYAIHKNKEEKSHWVISGALQVTFENGETYTLKAGDRDFIAAQIWYRAQAVGDEPLNYLVGEKIKAETTKRKRGRPKKL
jgi:quercetin dioxygenase-like cupin family protein